MMLATMDWVQWYNENRIHSYSADMLPKRYEEIYYRALESGKLTSSSATASVIAYVVPVVALFLGVVCSESGSPSAPLPGWS